VSRLREASRRTIRPHETRVNRLNGPLSGLTPGKSPVTGWEGSASYIQSTDAVLGKQIRFLPIRTGRARTVFLDSRVARNQNLDL